MLVMDGRCEIMEWSFVFLVTFIESEFVHVAVQRTMSCYETNTFFVRDELDKWPFLSFVCKHEIEGFVLYVLR